MLKKKNNTVAHQDLLAATATTGQKLCSGAVCLESTDSKLRRMPGRPAYEVRLPFPHTPILREAIGVQGQLDQTHHQVSWKGLLTYNESPDLESLSQRDLSRMLTAQDTVLPNKRCKRIT